MNTVAYQKDEKAFRETSHVNNIQPLGHTKRLLVRSAVGIFTEVKD